MTDIANRDDMLNPEAEAGRAPRDAGDLYAPEARGERSVTGLDDNPLAMVIGGLALGALAGALLPRTSREAELFGGAGRALNDRAQGAFRAAKDAGFSRLEGAGVDASAKDQLKVLFKTIANAIQEAGSAAAGAAKGGARTGFDQTP